ncbi:MAG TPA: EAL domain-containing protein, partial [Usitatibacter sp.]|nr:EAL domain-containing protein [Usitatibacter sp.]
VFDDTLRERVVAEHTTLNELHRALDRGELRVFFQPVVSLDRGRCVGAEALVRWQHPERGLLGPGEFIPLAEETGLIVPIGEWVLREAATEAARWATASSEPLTLSVNLSARQLAQQDLVAMVRRAMAETGIDPATLCLEITESAVMESGSATTAQLRALKSLGIRLAIDDFGTGFSSLAHLRRFPIDEIKIDRPYVAAMLATKGDAALVHSAIDLGRHFGFRVVAEGVDSDDVHAELKRLGCDCAQGFLFAKPMAEAPLRHWWGERA